MHLGMPECHKPLLGHCDLDLWPSFQELLCPEHISYIIWCRNPKFGVVIPLGMAEWCIQFWVILTLTLTSGFISRFFLLYYSYLSSNVSCARPIPLGAFVTCLWHFLLKIFLVIFGKGSLAGKCIDRAVRSLFTFKQTAETMSAASFSIISMHAYGAVWSESTLFSLVFTNATANHKADNFWSCDINIIQRSISFDKAHWMTIIACMFNKDFVKSGK